MRWGWFKLLVKEGDTAPVSGIVKYKGANAEATAQLVMEVVAVTVAIISIIISLFN